MRIGKSWWLALALGAALVAPVAYSFSARAQLDELLPTEERSRWLGCSVYNTPAGLVVRDIERPSFAARLGLQEGDLIYAIEGRRPRSVRQLHRYLFFGRRSFDQDVDILRMGRHVHAVIQHGEGTLDVIRPLQ